MSNLRVKVVLVDANGSELALGPFNQGVVVQSQPGGHGTMRHELVDVACGTAIASCFGGFWAADDRWFSQAFVQGMGANEEIR